MSWMDAIFLNNNKMSECKLRPFKCTQNMPKRPAGLAYIGSFINYLRTFLLHSLGVYV